MRNTLLAIAILVLAGPVSAAMNSELPVRKPGHWQITTIAEGLGMKTIDTCIGKDDSIAATTSQGQCTPPEVQHTGDQVIVNVTCVSKEGREKTSSLFTGDYTNWYHATVKMTFDPPAEGRPNIGATLDAKYLGPDCPKTERPQ